MTIGEVAQLITALAAVGGCLSSWRNSRKIEVIRHSTNSMKDDLVALTAKSSRAEGLKQGREEVRP